MTATARLPRKVTQPYLFATSSPSAPTTNRAGDGSTSTRPRGDGLRGACFNAWGQSRRWEDGYS